MVRQVCPWSGHGFRLFHGPHSECGVSRHLWSLQRDSALHHKSRHIHSHRLPIHYRRLLDGLVGGQHDHNDQVCVCMDSHALSNGARIHAHFLQEFVGNIGILYIALKIPRCITIVACVYVCLMALRLLFDYENVFVCDIERKQPASTGGHHTYHLHLIGCKVIDIMIGHGLHGASRHHHGT